VQAMKTMGHLGIARPVFGFGGIITAARATRFNKTWKPGDFELVDRAGRSGAWNDGIETSSLFDSSYGSTSITVAFLI
jgi:hypothetical protein